MATIAYYFALALIPPATAIVVTCLLVGRGALSTHSRGRVWKPVHDQRPAARLTPAILWCRLRYSIVKPVNRRKPPTLERLTWHRNLRRML